MSFRAVSCNAFRPGTAANNRETIRLALARADVLGVQEGADPAILDAMRVPGMGVYIPEGPAQTNPIAWCTALFDLVDKGWAKIFDNKAGIADGPDRYLVWVLLREKSTGKLFYFVNVHLIHQAFTSHPERKPSWIESVANVAKVVLDLMAKRPGVPVVMCGDWNAPGLMDFPVLLEREVASPATFGSRRYDRFFLVGNVRVLDGPDTDTLPDGEDFPTPSDHDSLAVKISLGAPPKPEVPVENNVTRAHVSFDKSMAYWYRANVKLAQAKPSRVVVHAVRATLGTLRRRAAATIDTLPES